MELSVLMQPEGKVQLVTTFEFDVDEYQIFWPWHVDFLDIARHADKLRVLEV